jgi:hypothetical protein
MSTKLSGFFAVAAIVAAMASTASATELCAGVTNVTTIGAGGCDVAGDTSVTFSNFAVTFAGVSSATVGIASTSFSDDEINLEFEISLGTEEIPGYGDIVLSYTVTGGISGVDNQFQASPLGAGGGVTIMETACKVPFTAGCPLPTTNTLANYAGTSTGQTVEDSASFGGVASPVYISKDITFSDATMSEFTNSQSTAAVPETETFSLMGAGLVGLGLLKRRFRK